MENPEFEKYIGELVRQARNQEPSPFLATRILQRIENEFSAPNTKRGTVFYPVLRPVAITLALAFGILIGAITAKNNLNDQQDNSLRTENLESLRTEFLITEHTAAGEVLNVTH